MVEVKSDSIASTNAMLMSIRVTLASILVFIITLTAGAKTSFNIRYFDKKIYHPNDEIEIKVIISNESVNRDEDITFYLSDNPIQSFGFNLAHLNGQQVSKFTGLASTLDNLSPYRIVNLQPGQEISMNISLGKWVDLSSPGQYRLFGYFYPKLRGKNNEVILADSILNLSILPRMKDRWKNALTEEVRKLLVSRNLSPLDVVMETLESRKFDRYYRASLYLDFASLAQISGEHSESLRKAVERGSWKSILGFLHPYSSLEFVSSQVSDQEAQINAIVEYNPLGQKYKRNLRFYLHKTNGYWTIRRIDNVTDDIKHVMGGLSPPQIVRTVINSIKQGDWEIALSHFDITDMVSRLPENIDSWKNLNLTDQISIIEDYRQKLIAGDIANNALPLNEIDSWQIINVEYGHNQGVIVVESQKDYLEGNQAFTQSNEYIFYLQKPPVLDGKWKIIQYETSIPGRQ